MIKIKNSLLMIAVLIVVIAFAPVDLRSEEEFSNPVADEMIGSSGVTWVPKVSYSSLVLTISRPDGTVFSKIIDSGSSPYANLSEIFGDSAADGSYTYELRVIPTEKRQLADRDEMAGIMSRDANGEALPRRALTQSGAFLVEGGAIVNRGINEADAGGSGYSLGSSGGDGLAGVQDQVINDDLIVTFSACIGNDCVNGESFGFDTLRLKENNLRIKFQDTSSSASFPTNDWQLTANDSSNGGANKFSIDDIDGGRTPFTIEAGAPSHSLYVDDGGRLGLGTSTPVVDVHAVSGNTPTLRLEQDGSSGFSPQTWDVAGNEANFFVRDATNGSKLPFKIKPSAPTNSLYIDANGDVGIGTQTPDFTFELERTGTGAKIIANRTDGATMEFSSSGSFGIAGTKTDHPVRIRVNDIMIMQLNGSGNYLEMIGNGTYDGNWNDASSRELKENIKTLTSVDAMKAFENLLPVEYNYKRDKEEKHVGFIAEDVPELLATKNRKNLSSMDIVAVLTKVLQEQQSTITELKKRVEELENRE